MTLNTIMAFIGLTVLLYFVLKICQRVFGRYIVLNGRPFRVGDCLRRRYQKVPVRQKYMPCDQDTYVTISRIYPDGTVHVDVMVSTPESAVPVSMMSDRIHPEGWLEPPSQTYQEQLQGCR